MEESQNKAYRLLSIYEAMNKGQMINKAATARQFHVNEKTIQRDLEEIKYYLSRSGQELQYSRARKATS